MTALDRHYDLAGVDYAQVIRPRPGGLQIHQVSNGVPSSEGIRIIDMSTKTTQCGSLAVLGRGCDRPRYAGFRLDWGIWGRLTRGPTRAGRDKPMPALNRSRSTRHRMLPMARSPWRALRISY